MTDAIERTSTTPLVDDDKVSLPITATLDLAPGMKPVVLRTNTGFSIPMNSDSLLPIHREHSSRQPGSGTIVVGTTHHPRQNPNGHHNYLLIGRQAATADIRIAHGSISRKHAVLYHDYDDSSARKDDGTQDRIIINPPAASPSTAGDAETTTSTSSTVRVMDLGGKHGTTVNGKRIPPHQPVVLHHGDQLYFGNVRESTFVVEVMTTTTTTAANTSPLVESARLTSDPTTDTTHEEDNTIKNDNESIRPTHTGDQELLARAGEGLTGRAKRQAEIEAMMASLDQTPSYHTYVEEQQEQQQYQVDERGGAPTDATTSATVDRSCLERFKLPITQTLRIPHETGSRNTATTLAIDPAGARFAVGSTSKSLRLFDFAGMNANRLDAFRHIDPDDGHWPTAIAYSNTGDRLIVGTGSVQPIIMDRDGTELLKFVRGDMYVTDQAKTLGHTAAVTSVMWHPLKREVVLTSSMDGSARLWNLKGRTQFRMLVCDKVFTVKNARGLRTAINVVSYHPSGREFAVGTACGSIQIWNPKRASGRPERTIFAAHGDSKPISSLVYNTDGSQLASRSVDDTQVKIWNQSRLSTTALPVVTCSDAPTIYEHANISYSPDGKLLCATTAVNRKRGRLNIYRVSGTAEDDSDSSLGSCLASFEIDPESSPIAVQWHTRLNQIFVACSDGRVIILFDPQYSTKGATVVANRFSRPVDDLSALLNSRAPKGSAAITGEIVAPFTLPLYQEDRPNVKRQKREDRKDPIKSREPERPATGKHKVGSKAGGSSFAIFVADQTVVHTKEIAGKDPREALLQYDEGPSLVESAYEGNRSKLAGKPADEDFE